MVTALQLALNGLALGAAYALVALGFVLVLNATGAVNFAQGDLVMAGGYGAAALVALLPVPGLVLLPVVMGAMALLGLVVSALAFFPLMRRPATAVFVSTIAIGLVLQNGALALFGPEPRTAPPAWNSEPLRWGELALSSQALAVVVIAALLVLGQGWLLARTRLGRDLRATAQDREMAAALGIHVNAMIALSFALAAALAGAAGTLLANQFFVTPTAGSALILKAYIAVVIGGWGSLAGAVAGALLVGLFETVVAAAVSYTAASALLYGALLVILLLRPQGLFGEAASRRA
ncbi:MAG TPA: branched-chain amino acid ABC transporter permease [Stellaceae bacterium]|nr:branched-chain amino acid ABC transporter permease [Stellaceae bacterium]